MSHPPLEYKVNSEAEDIEWFGFIKLGSGSLPSASQIFGSVGRVIVGGAK